MGFNRFVRDHNCFVVYLPNRTYSDETFSDTVIIVDILSPENKTDKSE